MPRLLVLISFLLVTSLTVPAQAEQAAGSSAPAEDNREYRYVYYPVQKIYYSTEQQIWFWMNDTGWSYGVELPAQFRANMGTGVGVMLDTTRPFDVHAYVEQRFGKPWRARHKEGSDKNSVEKRRAAQQEIQKGQKQEQNG